MKQPRGGARGALSATDVQVQARGAPHPPRSSDRAKEALAPAAGQRFTAQVVCSKGESTLKDSRRPSAAELEKSWLELLRFAARRLTFAGLDPSTDAADVVHEAVEALCKGQCPEGCSQIAFLKQTIKQRVFNRRRSTRLRQEKAAAVEAAGQQSPSTTPETQLVMTDLFDRALGALLELAEQQPNNDHLCSLILAYSERHEKRVDRMNAADLSTPEYRAAHKRLDSLILKLPAELRRDIIECLGEANNE